MRGEGSSTNATPTAQRRTVDRCCAVIAYAMPNPAIPVITMCPVQLRRSTSWMQPEDLFQLSRDLDKVINGAKNTVREAEAMGSPPDQATADMAVLLAEGVRRISAISDDIVAVADRIWYSEVKES
jgi:hypothetical protein